MSEGLGTVTATNRRRWLVPMLGGCGVLLLLWGLALGLMPVGGHAEGESFDCGSAWAQYDDGGYRGSDGYATCEDTRHGRVLGSVVLVLCGGALLVAAVAAHRRQSTHQP